MSRVGSQKRLENWVNVSPCRQGPNSYNSYITLRHYGFIFARCRGAWLV